MQKIKLLFVCTGNICRSPTADAVFAARAFEHGLNDRILVDSAGTHGYHIGDPPDSRTMSVAQERGVSMGHLRARQVKESDFYDFDLIFAMDRGHLQWLQAIQKNILQGADSPKLAELRLFDEKDVPDPYYGSPKDFQDVYEQIDRRALWFLADLSRIGRSF